ncbi:hypothetical protein M758_UG310500 [Ceratodon purpureus]|nr:hypothetical protein M758_UG310500 [Ceratodon purpureus]
MLSHYDWQAGTIVNRAINACLAPVYSVEGMHVVTVEGIGNRRLGLHLVQVRAEHAKVRLVASWTSFEC